MKKAVPPPSWRSKSHHHQPPPSQLSSQLSSQVSSQIPPQVPSQVPPPSPSSSSRAHTPKHSSITATFRSVFYRSPARATSATSLVSDTHSIASHTDPSSSSSFSSDPRPPSHPYANMVAAPLPVVSSHDIPEEEDECPVCLEPLSFSFRLPGEKPHIIPECGHALHEVRPLYLECHTTN